MVVTEQTRDWKSLDHSRQTLLDVFEAQEKRRNPTWWHRRTTMERHLTLLTCGAVFAAIALTVALSTVLVKQQRGESLPTLPAAFTGDGNLSPHIKHDENDLCLTEGCIHAASSALQSMDKSIEPCDDFYEFACGNYVKTSMIPDDKSSKSHFSIINDHLQGQLRTMIEEPLQPSETKPFRLVKDLYKACMNKTLIESRGLEPLKAVLKELGGWPVLDGEKWDEGSFTWLSSVYKFRKMGYSVDNFIDLSVETDAKNSTTRSINLDQASLGLSREYLVKGLKEPIVKAYYSYQVDIAVLLGADRAKAEKELMESLSFQIKLANISLPNEKRRNLTQLYNPMTVNQLQLKYPSIPWLEYLNTLLPEESQVRNDEVIVVSVPEYLKQFEKLMSHTPKRIMANYNLWRVVSSSVSYLTEDLRNRQLKFATTLTGTTEQEARWKECIDLVAGGVSLSVGSLYVRKYFKEEAKQNAMEMVQDIRTQFTEILKKVDWMDEETRKKGLEKAESMSVHIAYPDELLDNSKLEKFYTKLEVNPNLYLESILNLTKFGTNYSFGRLRQKVNKTEWITHGRPAVVNAYYSSIENSIQFPAGILQGQFFNNERPRYMNYGAIGFVIGHEITHGFDDQGRQFDKDGNLVDWWHPTTKEEYLKKATCIIEQYGNYTEPETKLNLNGINTQGENIADNGGIKEAYLAYVAWTERHGAEPKLPGLEYSPRQMFWISAAQSWCSKYRPEAMRLKITTGPHSPGKFRVLGPLSNMDAFSKDFSCPTGSNMNPIKKCSVW